MDKSNVLKPLVMLNLSKEKLLIIIALSLAGASLTASIVLGLQVIKLKQDLARRPFPTPTLPRTPTPIPTPLPVEVSPTPVAKQETTKFPSAWFTCTTDADCEVSLTISKSVYTRGEEIEVTIKNNSQGPIVTNDHKFACSILVLEHKTLQGWKSTGWCPLERQTLDVVIEAGEEKKGRLPTNPNQAYLYQELPVGVYRIKFSFIPGRSTMIPQVPKEKVVYSKEFQIL